MQFLNSDSTENRSQGSNEQQINIGSDNGLVLNRRQAIFWTHADLASWHIYASPGSV